jgi:aspartyl-tRNA(Asn)/glutamyl-tRNA(Gln) amidotransferase subunit A
MRTMRIRQEGPRLSAAEVASAVRNGERSAVSFVEDSLAAISELDQGEAGLNAFVTVMADEAMEHAAEIDRRVAEGADPGPLAGVPVALKDNICTRGVRTTCGSRILDGWRPPYDATVVELLEEAGAVVVGKANLDEFAMGSSTETSAFGATRNPLDPSKVPGGSSGGSAAAVAAGIVPVALGSDTGGSVRQPAAFCGVVGLKPTYGTVSRYGLVAFASSLDQIGPIAGCVLDVALVMDVIGRHDPRDSTSLERPPYRLAEALATEGGLPEGIHIGLVRELTEGADQVVARRVRDAAEALAKQGAHVEEVSLPEIAYALPAYYLIAPAEASSNLARYDGVRYGLRVDGADVEAMNRATRAAGFGAEVKRRIMLGTYALSAGYYDAYYAKAQRVRTLMIQAFARVYERFDVLLGATAPTTAFGIGTKLDDPLSMYLSDVCTIPSSLAGHPAVSVPFGVGDDGLPVGVQVLAPVLGETPMLKVAAAIEAAARAAQAGSRSHDAALSGSRPGKSESRPGKKAEEG